MMLQNEFQGPVNIGSEEMVSINDLVSLISDIAGKSIEVKHISGPTGVRGRNSNNDLIREKLNWDYKMKLSQGLALTYSWILEQTAKLT
jgi:nucleoside-diphosphate-sugar epimerase